MKSKQMASFLALAFLLSGAFASLVTIPKVVTAYMPHAPIKIQGNSEFTAANGVTAGTGTSSDPFIIEGWDITAPRLGGINIASTDAHFVIRNVYLHADVGGQGIFLSSVRNGRIENANVSNIDDGMEIDRSFNITVASSAISAVQTGITFWQTENVSVLDNSIYARHKWAIDFAISQNVTISSNEISSNDIPSEVFGIIISGTTAVVTRNNVSNCDGAILIEGDKPILIEGNNISDSQYGISLNTHPTNVTVLHNRFFDNAVQAVDWVGSKNNSWDGGYPSGGNFWTDYKGIDNCSGPNQDVCPDPDGIGDTPYVIDANNKDNYPWFPCRGDTVPPVVSISNPRDGKWIRAYTLYIMGGASDAGSCRLRAVYVRVRGGAWQLAAGTSAWGLWTTLAGGPNLIEAQASDCALNPSGIVSVTTLNDDSPPLVSITLPSDGSVFMSAPVTISGVASDQNGSGVERVEINVNGAGWSNASGTSSWSSLVDLNPGSNLIEARARDNTSQLSSPDSITVFLSTRPEASFTAVPVSGNINTIFAMDASSSSDLQDPSSLLEVRWDWENDGSWDTSWSTTKTAQHQYTALGTYTVRLEVRDTGGLTGNATRLVWVNNTPPVAVILLAPPPINTPPSRVYVDASLSSDLEDAVDNLSVRWDWENDSTWDTAWSTFMLTNHQYTTPGNHTICLEVRDTDGLTGSTCRAVELVDDAPPVITHTPHGDVALNEVITITANVTDDFSVKAVYLHYRFYGKFGEQSGSGTMFKMPNGTYMAIIPAQELAGTVYYSINATDFFGNEARSPPTGEYSFQAGHVENKPSADAIPLLIVSIIVIIVVIVAVAVAFLMKRRRKEPREPPAEQVETSRTRGKK